MSVFWFLSALLASVGFVMYKQDRRVGALAFYAASIVFIVLDLK